MPVCDCTKRLILVALSSSLSRLQESNSTCLKAHVWQATHFLIDVRWIRGHVLSALSGNTIPHVRGLTTRIKASSSDNRLRLLPFTLQNKHIARMHEPSRKASQLLTNSSVLRCLQIAYIAYIMDDLISLFFIIWRSNYHCSLHLGLARNPNIFMKHCSCEKNDILTLHTRTNLAIVTKKKDRKHAKAPASRQGHQKLISTAFKLWWFME